MNEKRRKPFDLRLLVGFLIVLAGVLMLLERMDIGVNFTFHTYWPMLLIILGIGKVALPGHRRQIFSGVILVVAGTLFQLKNLGFIFFHFHDLWPLVIILVGLSIICRNIWAPRLHFTCEMNAKRTLSGKDGAKHGMFCDDKGQFVNDVVDVSVLFGSGDYIVSSKKFKGGNVSATFGGIELDLRDTEINGDSVELIVTSSFGSVEIRTPSHWQVVLEGSPMLGSMENKTSTPQNVTKTLIIKGSASFGSVEIKN